MLINEIKPHLKQSAKIVFSFSSTIYRGGEVIPYHKTVKTYAPFDNLKDVKDYIKQCDERRLNYEDEEVWGRGYGPTENSGGGLNPFFFTQTLIANT